MKIAQSKQGSVPQRDFLTLAVGLALVVVVVVAIAHAQRQTAQRNSVPQPTARRNSGPPPVTDFDAPQPTDPKERALRELQDSVMAVPYRHPINESKADESETIFNAPPRLAIPVAQVCAIVIGTVLDSRAFVTADKTSVYSRFSVQVDQVVMQCSEETVAVGETVNAIRAGGAVRFGSGRVEKFWYRGAGFPRNGAEYLLFLRMVPQNGSFVIYTAYEFRSGEVLPLDDEPQFQRYDGMTVSRFIDLVRENIATGQRGVQQ